VGSIFILEDARHTVGLASYSIISLRARWSSYFLNYAKIRIGDHPVFSILHRARFFSALTKCEKGKGITFLNSYRRLMIPVLFVYFFPYAILHGHVIIGVQKFYIQEHFNVKSIQ